MHIPVAVITDADPLPTDFPDLSAPLTLSANAQLLQKCEDDFVKCFFASKTLEYDLAFDTHCRSHMLEALKEMHPEIGVDLTAEVDTATGDHAKAQKLFCGMFERGEGKTKVQKGAFAQLLACEISNSEKQIELPSYLSEALRFVVPPEKASVAA
jgi:putative ATP-dependent endonuclease of the OLD family